MCSAYTKFIFVIRLNPLALNGLRDIQKKFAWVATSYVSLGGTVYKFGTVRYGYGKKYLHINHYNLIYIFFN